MKKFWSKIKAWVFGRYVATSPSFWGQRSWLNTALQDARFDADASVRKELVRRHRYWVQNNGIIQRIRNLFIQFSVGSSGLAVNPNSTNDSWNENRTKTWKSWSVAPELGTRLSLSQLEIQWAGSLFDDGEIFIYKTSDGSKPMIQTIEAHRIETPPDLVKEEGKTIVDGVRLQTIPGVEGEIVVIGKPKSYYVRSGSTIDGQYQYKEIPADQIIHKFKARRPGMLRGIPEGFSVMNQLHDMDDLQMYTMQKAKAAAIVMNVIKNASGEANTQTMRRTRLQLGTTDNTGSATFSKEDPQFYDVKLGAYNQYLKTGEEMDQFRSEEPGVVTQQYWDYLTNLICCGYNVPKLLVMPYSLQGTVTRADLDICTNAFRFNFELVAAALREIYEWQTEWAVKFDRNQKNARPEDYLRVEISPPRAPNVDIGRNAQALAVELELGTITYQDVFTERQQNMADQFRQAAEAAKMIQDLAKEYGVTPEDIAKKIEKQVTEPQPPDTGAAKTADTLE